MRLMDIDKVIDGLREPYNNGTYRGVDYDQTDAAAFEEALEAAYKKYGIEAEPVRRGKWAYNAEGYYIGLTPISELEAAGNEDNKPL